MNKVITFILFLLSLFIALTLLLKQSAPWILITIYWSLLSIKYLNDLYCRDKNEE